MKIDFSKLLMIVGVVAVAYLGLKYVPVFMRKWDMSDIARNYAAKLMFEPNENKIREEIANEVKAKTGVQLNMSFGKDQGILVKRQTQPSVEMTVTLRWTETVTHIWGSKHVMPMQVTKVAVPAGVMKNAP